MRINKQSWLINKPIAHRGLWSESVPENSATAYTLASEKNIPVEIDLFLTTDGEIVSFHDDDLERLTGVKGKIYEKSYEELKKLRLNGTDQTIPTLKEVLRLTEGKSPLLIEIKNQPNGKELVKKTVEILKDYNGEFAVQSFNPLYIKTIKKLAPEFICGILSYSEYKSENKIESFIVRKMPLNVFIKPDFISTDKKSLPLPKRKAKNKVIIAWTILSKEEEITAKSKGADNVIYECYVNDKYL